MYIDIYMCVYVYTHTHYFCELCLVYYWTTFMMCTKYHLTLTLPSLGPAMMSSHCDGNQTHTKTQLWMCVCWSPVSSSLCSSVVPVELCSVRSINEQGGTTQTWRGRIITLHTHTHTHTHRMEEGGVRFTAGIVIMCQSTDNMRKTTDVCLNWLIRNISWPVRTYQQSVRCQ